MTFLKRLIELEFALGTGTFGEDGSNVLKVSGLRIQADIIKAGGNSAGEGHVRVWGLTLSHMNALSALTPWAQYERKNTLTLKAGDEGQPLSIVFTGQITQAWINLNSQPDACLEVVALAGLYEALKPVAPISFPGAADVADILKGLAERMGYAFENNGVTAKLWTPYFDGTARDQLKSVVRAAGIHHAIDSGTLAIWPQGGSRAGGVPTISADTGMVGYPSYTGNGIAVRTIFNPEIRPGGVVAVESLIQPASGRFVVYGLSYELSSEMPGGPWFTQFSGVPEYLSAAGARP